MEKNALFTVMFTNGKKCKFSEMNHDKIDVICEQPITWQNVTIIACKMSKFIQYQFMWFFCKG